MSRRPVTGAPADRGVHGSFAPGFEPVVEAFAATVGPRGGSAVHVLHRGEVVVDVWHGTADEVDGRPWLADTPTPVFSCTKGLLSILVAQLVQQGRLALDAPVAAYWPEFAAAGKEGVSVRQALSHRAGLPALRDDVDRATALDWDAITARLAAEAPLWEPGTRYGYHALTFGWLAGELVRRVTGSSVGAVFARELARPLSADAWIGVPADAQPRVARLLAGETVSTSPPSTGDREVDPEEGRWMQRAMTLGAAFPAQLVLRGEGFDAPEVQRAEVPGAGGIASAAALASLWSSTIVDAPGVVGLSDEVIDDMTTVRSEGEPVWWFPGPYPRWGTGFMIPSRRRAFLSESSFGHDGAGGQVAFADRAHDVGFAYVTNLMQMHSDDRGDAVVRALASVLERG